MASNRKSAGENVPVKRSSDSSPSAEAPVVKRRRSIYKSQPMILISAYNLHGEIVHFAVQEAVFLNVDADLLPRLQRLGDPFASGHNSVIILDYGAACVEMLIDLFSRGHISEVLPLDDQRQSFISMIEVYILTVKLDLPALALYVIDKMKEMPVPEGYWGILGTEIYKKMAGSSPLRKMYVESLAKLAKEDWEMELQDLTSEILIDVAKYERELRG